MIAIAAVGMIALVVGLYFGTATRSTLPSQSTPIIPVLQTNQSFTQNNRTYDQAVIPVLANRPYRLDGITFTYLGNTTADAGQCPPADLKPFNTYYPWNEIKHFSAVLKNGTGVNIDTCWPLPHIPSTSAQSHTGSGVSLPLQKRVESRWFDQNSKTAGIIQDPSYFMTGNTTFYYFAER